MKPAVTDPNPVGVELTADRALRLTWSDGPVTRVAVRKLRLECPCAGCVDEWTHQRTLDASTVPEEISAREIDQVGNYALSIHFTDGHETGIFSWKLLRELSEVVPPPTS
jgi:DUF971 family protein